MESVTEVTTILQNVDGTEATAKSSISIPIATLIFLLGLEMMCVMEETTILQNVDGTEVTVLLDFSKLFKLNVYVSLDYILVCYVFGFVEFGLSSFFEVRYCLDCQ